METEGGGWTELLSRRDGIVDDFALQTYSQFSIAGHGQVGGDSILPLDFWNSLTSAGNMELLVQIKCNLTSFWSGYGSISVGSSASGYTLSLSDYDSSSTAGDGLSRSSGHAFSTFDSDRDASLAVNCALQYGQPFWNNDCGDVNPLGLYGNTNSSLALRWDSLSASCSTIDQVFFRVRRNRCASGNTAPCSSCKNGFFLTLDPVTGREACFPFCQQQICSECHPTNPSVCVGRCISGYFLDPSTRSCQRCHSLCEECSSSFTAPCSKCVSTAYSVPDLEACAVQCPPGFFEFSPQVCEPCSYSNCEKCSATECLACKQSYFLSNGTCHSACPSGFYGDLSDGVCKPCAFGCLTCFGPSRQECFTCFATDFHYQRHFTCSPYCPLTSFFDPLSQSCKGKSHFTADCDPNCAECFGPSSDECQACAPGRSLRMNSCSRCEDTPGLMTDPFDSGTCAEICGDGIDLGFNECEDGNLFNLDGCNSSCQLELDFECSSLSPTGPFHCKSLKPPSLIFAQVTEEMNLELFFSEPIVTTDKVTLADIEFEINPPKGSRSISFSPLVSILQTVPVSTLLIPLQLRSSLFGGEQLTFTFKTPHKIRDLDHYSLVTREYSLLLPEYEYFSVTELQVMDGSSSLFSTDSLKGFLINFLLFLVVLFFSGLLWNLANFVQLLNLLPALNIFIPRNVRVLFSFLDIANLNIQFLQDLLNLSLEGHYSLESFATSNHLSPMLPYTQILLNEGVLLLSWLLFICFVVSLIILQRIASTSCKRRSLSLCQKCSFSYLALGLLESTLILTLASLHNLTNIGYSTALEVISAILSALLLGLLMTLPFWMIRIFSRHFTEYEETSFLSRYRHLSSLLSLKSRHHVLVIHFYSLFVARRLLFVFILFFLFDFPKMQLLLLASLSLMIILWIYRARPFRDRLMSKMEILNESCLVLVIIILASIQLWEILREKASMIGWCCISLVLFCILVNFLTFCPRESKSTIKAWKRACRRSKTKAFKIHIQSSNKPSARREKFKQRDSTTELKLQIKEPPKEPLRLFWSNLGVIRETGEVFSERNELEQIPEDPMFKLRVPQPRRCLRSSLFRQGGQSLYI